MEEYCGRPEDFGGRILVELASCLKRGDILIHLGDISMGHDEDAHNSLNLIIPGGVTRILVRGNHDKKSNKWYLEQGWDFVCESFTDTYFGKKVLFSHTPAPIGDYDINFHGHFHNSPSSRWEPEYVKNLSKGKHKLLVLEDHYYKPWNLQEILKNITTKYVKIRKN
jgi:calcineurin-like phosphoesterase family protein